MPSRGFPLSVTRMLRSPLLNLLSAPRRLGWLIWPWMGTPPNPRFLRISAIRLVLSQVLVKICRGRESRLNS